MFSYQEGLSLPVRDLSWNGRIGKSLWVKRMQNRNYSVLEYKKPASRVHDRWCWQLFSCFVFYMVYVQTSWFLEFLKSLCLAKHWIVNCCHTPRPYEDLQRKCVRQILFFYIIWLEIYTSLPNAHRIFLQARVYFFSDPERSLRLSTFQLWNDTVCMWSAHR